MHRNIVNLAVLSIKVIFDLLILFSIFNVANVIEVLKLKVQDSFGIVLSKISSQLEIWFS